MNPIDKQLKTFFQSAPKAPTPTASEIREAVDSAIPARSTNHALRRTSWFGIPTRVAAVGVSIGCIAAVAAGVVSYMSGSGLDGTIVSRAAAAAAIPEKSVIHVKERIEYHVDGKIVSNPGQSPAAVESWQAADGRGKVTVVDYSGEITTSNLKPIDGAGAVEGDLATQDPTLTYRLALRDGKDLKVEGKRVVDGIPVYEITKVRGAICLPEGYCEVKQSADNPVKMSIFVDQKTYRPVKLVISFPTEPGSGFSDKAGIQDYVVYFEEFEKLPLNSSTKKLLTTRSQGKK